ncbi:MAG: hypothetical protein IPK12_13535 [Gemmatimonadetes bacterium]|nr:hypothetical protein [Gemmatimonadota bacterium]
MLSRRVTQTALPDARLTRWVASSVIRRRSLCGSLAFTGQFISQLPAFTR